VKKAPRWAFSLSQEQEKQDERDRNADKPKQNAFSHLRSPFLLPTKAEQRVFGSYSISTGLKPSSLRTAAAEFPIFSITRSSSSRVILRCRHQYFTSSSSSMLILLRSGLIGFPVSSANIASAGLRFSREIGHSRPNLPHRPNALAPAMFQVGDGSIDSSVLFLFSDGMPPLPSQEARALAEKMLRRAVRGKTSTLTPESTRICVRAIQIILQRPNRKRVMSLICSDRTCSRGGSECVPCLMKANAIMNLYEEGEAIGSE
jgi:hypothetical protein